MRFVFILGFCLTLGIGNAHARKLTGVEQVVYISAFGIEVVLIGLSARGVAYKACEKPLCAPNERKICCTQDTIATDGQRVVGGCREFQESVFSGHCGASLPVCKTGYIRGSMKTDQWYCQSGTGPASLYSNSTSPAKTINDSNIPGGYSAYLAAIAGVMGSVGAFLGTALMCSCMIAKS